MSSFYSTVFAGCLCTIISALVVFFIVTVGNKEKMHDIVIDKITENTRVHNAIKHQYPVIQLIDEHKKDCIANSEIIEVKESIIVMRTALIFLVRKAGGEPKDIGLTK